MPESTVVPEVSPASIDAPAPAPMAAEWIALPTQAATVAMITGLFAGLLLGAGLAIVVGWPLATLVAANWWSAAALVIVLWLLLGALGAWIAYRRWRSTGWRLDATGLHVKRGRAWRREVLIPRSRVQHLDIERGPIERQFTLATLVVHTAGTRQHALRLAGLQDADAVALRDALVPASDRHDDVL